MSNYKRYKRKLRWKSTIRKHADVRLCPECGMPISNAWTMSCPNCGADVFTQQWPEVEHPFEPPLPSPEVPNTIPQDFERPNLTGPVPNLPSNPDASSSGLTVPKHFERGNMTSEQEFAAFLSGYFGAALWTSEVGEEFAEAQAAEFGHDESFQALHPDGLDPTGSMSDAGLDESTIDESSKAEQAQECRNFVNDHSADLHEYLDQLGFSNAHGWSQAGHDFWLTRNGHGAGFWDRDPGELGRRLTDAAKVYGEAYAYMGADGAIYFH